MITDEVAARDWLRTLPECDDAAMGRLEMLAAMLAEENARQNLVSAASLGEVWRRHIADSAQLLRLVPKETEGLWLDLGTGAGFPGLVIAVLRPDLRMLMVESRNRRIGWLESARLALGLTNAEVIGTRLEALPSAAMAVISARAFAPLPQLLTLSARFSTSATCWLLPKGRHASQELAALKGWRQMFHVEHSLTDLEAGIITGHLLGKM